MTPPLSPEDRFIQAKRVAELVGLLRAFLAGQKNRADIARWTNDAWPARQGTRFPRHGAAHTVFESLQSIEDRDGDGFVLRNQDVAAYLEWLTKGDPFTAAREPLFSISTHVETLATVTGGREERWWLDGLGLMVSLRFASPATGRCFCAISPLRDERRLSAIHTHRDDDPTEAALDALEVLAIDEPNIAHWHSQIEPAIMPRWTVWRQDDNGGRFQVATYLAYSRAMRECGELESRGHKQMYWVDRHSSDHGDKPHVKAQE